MVIDEVVRTDVPISVKEYLYQKGLSRSIISGMKRSGIFVNDEPVTVRRMMADGDRIRLHLDESGSECIPPIDIPLNIVYEDEELVIVDKPTSMPTHPSRGNSLPTLANAVMARYGEGFVFRAITRLDRDTSGLVLIAKNAISASKLSAAMKSGEIKKRYEATVVGIPSPECGVIDAPIERESPDSIKRTVREDGKPSLTEYRVVRKREGESDLEILLHTGRTHQIRVHMAYIGHPLKGDFLYGVRNDVGYSLRCMTLTFPHPCDGRIITVRADECRSRSSDE